MISRLVRYIVFNYRLKRVDKTYYKFKNRIYSMKTDLRKYEKHYNHKHSTVRVLYEDIIQCLEFLHDDYKHDLVDNYVFNIYLKRVEEINRKYEQFKTDLQKPPITRSWW